VHVIPRLDDVVAGLMRMVQAGDAVITLGAGSIGSLPPRLLERLAAAGVGGRA
jgi:UDP-N-acetylmuramate-alanine ligase